jgi:hypothetical protein
MNVSFLASIILFAGSIDSMDVSIIPENWIFGYDCLIDASAGGKWINNHPVIDSTGIDAAVSVRIESQEVDFLATGAIQSDSISRVLFRRGRGSVKWPGTPWIGAGVYLNDRQPFIAGLSNPVVEWGWVDIDSIQGYGLSSGGILGFRGEYLIQLTHGDTLTQLDVHSPWMGFLGVDYSRAQLRTYDSIPDENIIVNVLSVRGDFRYFSPWLIVAGADGEQGKWAVSGEIREYSPFDTRWGSIEIVPGIHFAGNNIEFPGSAFVSGQKVITLGAFLESRRYFASAGIKGMVDLESDSLSGVSASAGLISRAGVAWDVIFDYYADGDYRTVISSVTSDSYASAGIAVEIINDSSRVTGSASYSPRDDVCAELTVSGDIDDSLQPACGLAVSTALGPVTGLVRIDWNYADSPSFRIDLRGLLK